MAFRFSLESILQLRRSQEQLERLKLEAIIWEQRQMRARLEGVIERSVESRHRFQQELAAGLTGSELQFQAMRQENTAAVRASLQDHLLELERSRLDQLLVFHKFRQRREILEKLRLRKLEVYAREQSRREQQELDDLFLMRQEIVRNESN
jgi:flagellar export protein FliJ